MNEANRAAFAEAENDLEALGVDAEILDEVEKLWLRGDQIPAAWMLAKATSGDLSFPQAKKLLCRVYGEG
jgi:hypothetical protein